jgi:hypothetical protein
MAHYACIDENNLVTLVFVGKEETELLDGKSVDWEEYYGAKRTSYNVHGGVHKFGKPPLRKNYAGVGYIYDAQRDAFIPPKPFPSWCLNDETCLWEPPVPMPTDGMYIWDEPALAWVQAQN